VYLWFKLRPCSLSMAIASSMVALLPYVDTHCCSTFNVLSNEGIILRIMRHCQTGVMGKGTQYPRIRQQQRTIVHHNHLHFRKIVASPPFPQLANSLKHPRNMFHWFFAKRFLSISFVHENHTAKCEFRRNNCE